MSGSPSIVVDTNVLLNLATPVVDSRQKAPSGEDPLKVLLTVYDVHIPDVIFSELSQIKGGNDLLSKAADLVLKASSHVTTHSVDVDTHNSFFSGLDEGEICCILLANDLEVDMFVTDEFNSTNYVLIGDALFDRNILFTTPHVLCVLANNGFIDRKYVDMALTYYVNIKDWDHELVEFYRQKYL